MHPDRRNLLINGTLACIGAVMAPLLSASGAARVAIVSGNDEAAALLPAESGAGKKFDAHGHVQPFPGNTVICPIPRTNPAYDTLSVAYAMLYRSVAVKRLATLPASSFHMTVFEGADDSRRHPGDWPHLLPLDAGMDVCNRYIAERLRKAAITVRTPIRMKISADDVAGVPTVVYLQPADAGQERQLRELREQLSAVTGIRHQNHDRYRFHTSFAYYVDAFSTRELASYRAAYARMIRQLCRALPLIELGPPAYCLFDDMTAFRPQFVLGG